MKFLFLVAALALAGCTSISDVSPMGDGKYTVGSSVQGGFSTWAEVQSLAVKRAAAYCQAQGKEISDVNVQTHGARGWTPQEVEVTFKCAASADSGGKK